MTPPHLPALKQKFPPNLLLIPPLQRQPTPNLLQPLSNTQDTAYEEVPAHVCWTGAECESALHA